MIRALPVIRTRYYTIYAYDEIAHVRVPPGYADHPEDERIFLFPHKLTNDSSFGDILLLPSQESNKSFTCTFVHIYYIWNTYVFWATTRKGSKREPNEQLATPSMTPITTEEQATSKSLQKCLSWMTESR